MSLVSDLPKQLDIYQEPPSAWGLACHKTLGWMASLGLLLFINAYLRPRAKLFFWIEGKIPIQSELKHVWRSRYLSSVKKLLDLDSNVCIMSTKIWLKDLLRANQNGHWCLFLGKRLPFYLNKKAPIWMCKVLIQLWAQENLVKKDREHKKALIDFLAQNVANSIDPILRANSILDELVLLEHSEWKIDGLELIESIENKNALCWEKQDREIRVNINRFKAAKEPTVEELVQRVEHLRQVYALKLVVASTPITKEKKEAPLRL